MTIVVVDTILVNIFVVANAVDSSVYVFYVVAIVAVAIVVAVVVVVVVVVVVAIVVVVFIVGVVVVVFAAVSLNLSRLFSAIFADVE